jgi:hypothetical protein
MITEELMGVWAEALDSIRKHEVKIAVVGSREDAWGAIARQQARATMAFLIGRAWGQYSLGASGKKLTIISGACPKGGVDIWVRDLCRDAGIHLIEFNPGIQTWGGVNGYKARNDRIAEECDVMLVIRSDYAKTRGSLYTGERAEQLGKPVVWVTI